MVRATRAGTAAFKCLLRACLIYSLTLWALVQLFPQLFIMIFNSSPELVDYASWALRIYMAATGIFGIQIACQQTFVALGNAKISLFLAVLRKIILLIPFIYILPNFFADKAFAVFLAEPVADFLAVCTTATMFAVHFKNEHDRAGGKARRVNRKPDAESRPPLGRPAFLRVGVDGRHQAPKISASRSMASGSAAGLRPA